MLLYVDLCAPCYCPLSKAISKLQTGRPRIRYSICSRNNMYSVFWNAYILIPLASSQHNLYDIYLLLCMHYQSPDDGQKTCPKHVEFYSKNECEKLLHFFGFIIRIYHDARSSECQISPLTPNDLYRGRTAPLTSKRCILYIYSTNIVTEHFKHGIYSPFFSLQNVVCFIILTYLVPVLFTFYIQSVLKI